MRFSELDGARVGVWGAGREIGSFAEQLARRLPGAHIAVAAFDGDPPPDAGARLKAPGVRIVAAPGAAEALAGCEIVVRSPGVSIHRPELRAVIDAGVPVTTPTSLWLSEHGSDGVLAVTGTKGKSTTAALAAHLARAAGVRTALAGNIGVPALDLLDSDPAELTVLELSSYQIADLDTGPEVAIFTNLFREHTDWHGSEQAYRADKLRLLELPGLRVAVLNAREEALAGARPPAAAVTFYGTPAGWDAGAEGITLAGRLVVSTDELPLRGAHNALNLSGALAGLEAIGVSPPPLPDALEGFAALEHRLQDLGADGPITWVDDSISTTPESTIAAIASFPAHELVLIAGGQDRGQDYSQLAHALAARGASVIGVPTTGPLLVAAARAAGVPELRALEAPGLAAAVELARALLSAAAAEGSDRHGVVLLSPAAPSYDHFRDFEERGERFAALAHAAVEGQPG